MVTLFLYIESKFIWNIQIEGIDRISEERIKEVLEENGIKIGMLRSKINQKEIINKVRLEEDDIAWMNIDLRGTNVIVEIAETTEKPEIVSLDEYCNIVATKDAKIVKVTAGSGTIVTNVGDDVTKGSILIGGWMEGKYTGTRYVHAMRRCKRNCEI